MVNLTISAIVIGEIGENIKSNDPPEVYLEVIERALVRMKSELEMYRRNACESCTDFYIQTNVKELYK